MTLRLARRTRRRRPPTRTFLALLGVLQSGVLVVAGVAGAQTFYKWTDERGVVHFSDLPPNNVQEVEERNLPKRSDIVTSPAPPADAGRVGVDITPGATPGTAPQTDPAKVVIVSRVTPRTGPSALHVSGEVKNIGGAEAQDVAVTISVADATQGTPCLEEEADVVPSTLRGGDSGNFDIDLDSPCLYGNPSLDIAPTWK
jgi:hypothetical protein